MNQATNQASNLTFGSSSWEHPDHTPTSSQVSNILQLDFDTQINIIKKKFFSWSDNLHEYKTYFQDPNIISQLNDYIFSHLGQIAENSSLDSYNEIYFFLYLNSLHFWEDLFNSGDIYNQNNFIWIFDKYLERITSFQDLNTQEAYYEIESFARLCGILNIICLLNQNNNLKREFIFSLTRFVEEKIKIVLIHLQSKNYTNEKIKNSLEYILWLFALNFSYITYINFKNQENLDTFLKKHKEMLTATIAWYKECQTSKFWNDEKNRKPVIQRAFIVNITYIISLILLKLNWKIDENTYFSHPDFVEIKNIFQEQISHFYKNKSFQYQNIEEIKNICNFIFITNYKNHHTSGGFRNLKPLQWLSDILGHFAHYQFTTEADNVDNLEIIHHLLLFNENLEAETIFRLLNILCKQTISSSNINFEIIHLKILNIALSRLAVLRLEKLKPYLKKLLEYIDTNKASSHLLYSYSLMYFSIGYCYSFFDDEESQNQAFENYAKFSQINYDDFDFQRYGIDISRFYFNIGKYKEWRLDIPKNRDVIPDQKEEQKIIWWWELFLSEFSKTYINNTIKWLLSEFDTFLLVHKDEILNLTELSEEVAKILWSIFYWVSEIKVINLHDSDQTDNIPRHIKYKDFSVINGYIVRMIYPITFASDFDYLYHSITQFEHHNEKVNFPTQWVIGKLFEKLRLFLKTFNEKHELDLLLAQDFEKALTQNGIEISFQWIYDKTQRASKFEIFSRFKTPKKILGKQYNIRDYLDAIDRLERHDLSREIIQKQCLVAQNMIHEFPHLSFSINMEYSNIIDDNLIKYLVHLEKSWFPTDQITLELIEWKWHNYENVIYNLKILKAHGFTIAIDDFWTGESSINRLLWLLDEWLVHYVKIDGDIVKRLKSEIKPCKNWTERFRIRIAELILGEQYHDKKSVMDKSALVWKSTIKMIIEICEIYGIWVIAEYIETEELFKELKKFWVEWFQWYHLSKPISEEEFRNSIKNWWK